MSDHVIEFNGKRYDANNGVYLGKSHIVPGHIINRSVRGRSIKNFFRSMQPESAKTAQAGKGEEKKEPSESETFVVPVKVKKTGKPTSQEEAPTTIAVKVKTKAKVAKVVKPKPALTQPNGLSAHHPQHSKTLARQHIQKPQFTMKANVKQVRTPVEVMAKPQSALIQKQSVYGIDPLRQYRATRTDKHPAIQHFTKLAHSEAHALPAQTEIPIIAVQPAPLQMTARPATPVTRPHTDVFEAAIARATSHEQPQHKVRRKRSGKRRALNALAVTAVFLVIGGFISYLNLPGIEMRVASIQAGFGASLPTYAPTGYALTGGVERSDGTISVGFRSGSSQYRITQQASNWDSQTLLENTVALNGPHQTVQENGQIIYIYQNGGTNASWINGGVRYDLTGNAELSQSEVVSIVTSL